MDLETYNNEPPVLVDDFTDQNLEKNRRWVQIWVSKMSELRQLDKIAPWFFSKNCFLMEESRRKLIPEWCQSFYNTSMLLLAPILIHLVPEFLPKSGKEMTRKITENLHLDKISPLVFLKELLFNGGKLKETDPRSVPKLLKHLQAPFDTNLDPFGSRISPKKWKRNDSENNWKIPFW